MSGKSIDDILHRIREEIEKEREGLTPEERLELDKRLFEEYRTRYQRKVRKAPEGVGAKEG